MYEERTEHQELLIFDSHDWGRVLTLDGVVDRACPQLSQITVAARWIAPRKWIARLS